MAGAFLLTAVPAPAAAGSVPVEFIGWEGYSGFTRLVFGTGGSRPENFKIAYDEVGRKVVFVPRDGTSAFSFKPFENVDQNVTAIDYIQLQPGKLGVVVRLGKAVVGMRVAYLYDPNRLVLDICRQGPVRPFMPVNREVKTVALDPGHGGVSPGVVGEGALSEADVVYKLAVKLKALLESRGFRVIMTRDADKGPDPYERAGLANSERADVFLSLHADGHSGGDAATVLTSDEGALDGTADGGTPMLWSEQNAPYLTENLKLARKLAAQLGALQGGREPHVRNVRVYGFEGLAMPAVMVELSGLSGDGGQGRLSDGGYLDRAAAQLAEGVETYSGGVGR